MLPRKDAPLYRKTDQELIAIGRLQEQQAIALYIQSERQKAYKKGAKAMKKRLKAREEKKPNMTRNLRFDIPPKDEIPRFIDIKFDFGCFETVRFVRTY